MGRWERFFCRVEVTTNAAVGVGCAAEYQPRREQRPRRWKRGRNGRRAIQAEKAARANAKYMENGAWTGKGSKHNVIPFPVVWV